MSSTDESGKGWSSVTLERRGAVAVVTLVGPGKGNAMGPEFWSEMPEVMRAVDRDRALRACVIRGSGKCFSVGLDLMRTMGELSPMLTGAQLADQRRELLALIERYQEAVSAVARARVPVVAAVHSYCLGGGLDLIAASDIRVAATDAVFSLREVRIAIVADVGSLQRLPGIVGEGRTREWALTGRDFDAAEALRTGLVTSVHEGGADGVFAAALAVAEGLAKSSPVAVEGVKAVMNDARSGREREDLRRVALWNAAFLSSKDLQEAFVAFAERREPRFE
jgi:enoyl-CoA hydratase